DKLYTCSYTEGGPAKGSCALQAGDLCKAFTNASFNGVTHEIEGWLRILSLEDVGKQYDCGPFNHTYPCEWSWISMRGQYDDGFGNTGNYSTVGTEVDTQEYLGDPDVNPEEVPLYSLFGWAWGAETTDFSSRSIWLPPVNVNQNPRGTDQDDHVTDGPRMAVDSKGNPHFVWTNMRPSAPTQADIFYIKWDGTKWVNAAGIEYDPDNPDTTTIVNYGLLEVPTWSAFGPTLALDSDDNPHIAFSRMAAIYYLKWNSAESTWETADGTDREDVPATGGFHVSVGGGYGASLALDRLNIPYVAYSSSETSYNDIYFKKWDTSAGDWRSITGDSNNLNVSNSDPTASTSKHLVLSNETTQLPHIIWNERNCAPYGQIYYRKWDPGTAAWTDIDPSDGPDDDVQVNAGVTGLLGIGSDCEGYNPSFDLYENNTPGIAWIDSPHLLYRKWDAGADAWVSVTGDVGADQLQINDYYNMPWYFIPQVKIYDDKPNIAWSDRREWTPTRNDIFLRYWNPDADSGNGDWVTASGNYGSAQSQNDPNFNISNSPSSHSGAPELIMDRFGSQHVAWWEQEWSDDLGCDGLTCASFADCPATHPQCDYYGCPGPTPDGKCVSYEVQYSKFIPGRFQSGLGWLEVMPVGALIGIPWVETMYSNIYAQSSIQLAPPPRGSDDYTSTYLILADGSISGISSYYADTQTGPPTSGFYQPGLNSLIGGECNISGYLTEEACALGGGTWTPGAGFPLGQNVLDTLDIDGLITAIDGRNRFGHEVNLDGTGGLEVDISSSAIFNSVPNPVLDGKIYHFSGADHYVLDNEMTFLNGDYVGPPATSGNGLIVIDGDLEINANTYYDATPLDSATGHISELASVAIIVRGNVYINSIVDEIAGVFVALDNPGTAGVTEGVISTSRRLPATQTIVAAADDAYASKAGAAYTNAHNLGLLRFGTDTLNRIYRSYLRWGLGTNANDINIPPDSDIKSAKISLYSEGTAPLGDFTARIYLIDHNDVFDYGSGAFNSPPGPGSAIDLYEISTTNSVGYDLEVGEWNGAAGEENITPDIRTLVQKYISSDEYEQNYYNGTTSHLGIVIKEGDAVAGSDQHRTFSSFEGGNPAMIEIEFTPKQVQYDIPNFEDDTMAWGPGALEVDDVPDPIFGWDGVVGEEYKKAFLRFVGIDIPVQAEILDAHMRATIGTTNGITGFQVRQGLMADYPDFSTNPFSEPLTDDVSEIAQTIGDNEWVNGDVVYFRDVVTLVESFIDRTDYNPGVAGSSEFVMRLRRGSDSVEQTAGAGEYRSIGSQTSNLVVNYQLPLSVSGLFVAKGYNFDREYTRDLAPSEKIVYDGRVVANTPPGLSDFTSVLPVYQRVIP
ncbi:hypothetical protein KKC06_04870, partial [Patescibacteria group bacterium]|nr:hypothetical protein [Patescibacteria group bacterium]